MNSDDVAGLLPLVILVVIAYLLLIRPARKRARDVAAVQQALSPGDEVMLNSGIFATVVAVDAESIDLEVSPGVVVKAHRAAVGRIITDVPAEHDTSDDSTSSDRDPDDEDSQDTNGNGPAGERSDVANTRTSHPGRTLLIFLFVITVMFIGAGTLGSWKPKLGLDLQGGTRITLQAKAAGGSSVTEDKLDEAVGIISSRVNGAGVAEAVVTTQGSDIIIVEIPGEVDKDLTRTIGSTAQLRFRLVAAALPPEGTATPTPTEPTDTTPTTPTETDGSTTGPDSTGSTPEQSAPNDNTSDTGTTNGNNRVVPSWADRWRQPCTHLSCFDRGHGRRDTNHPRSDRAADRSGPARPRADRRPLRVDRQPTAGVASQAGVVHLPQGR